MSEDYTYPLHDNDRFLTYYNFQWGFKLPESEVRYFYDQNKCYSDLNGCLYNQEAQPVGWIVLNQDGSKFKQYNMEKELVKEGQNFYYSNQTFKAEGNQISLKDYQKQHQDKQTQKDINNSTQNMSLKQFQQRKQNENNSQNQPYNNRSFQKNNQNETSHRDHPNQYNSNNYNDTKNNYNNPQKARNNFTFQENDKPHRDQQFYNGRNAQNYQQQRGKSENKAERYQNNQNNQNYTNYTKFDSRDSYNFSNNKQSFTKNLGEHRNTRDTRDIRDTRQDTNNKREIRNTQDTRNSYDIRDQRNGRNFTNSGENSQNSYKRAQSQNVQHRNDTEIQNQVTPAQETLPKRQRNSRIHTDKQLRFILTINNRNQTSDNEIVNYIAQNAEIGKDEILKINQSEIHVKSSEVMKKILNKIQQIPADKQIITLKN